MLIEIINCNILEFTETEHEKISAINHLMFSHGCRHHIIVTSRKIIKDILSSEHLTSQSQIYASDISTSLNEYAHYKTLVKFILQVDFNYDATPEYSISTDNIKVMKVSYKYFSDHSHLSLAKILTEDISDYSFYTEVARAKLGTSNLNLPFKLEFHNGGGSQIKNNFDHLKNNKSVCLCIVDTDKKHPKGGEGSTSSSFATSDRSFNSSAFAKIIDAHEVESFIPESVMTDIVSAENDNQQRIESLDILTKLNSIDGRVRQYFDHKNGLSLKNAIALDNAHGEFWLPLLENIPKFAAKSCLKNRRCTKCQSCPKISGYGDNILSKSVDKLRIMTPQKIAEQVSHQLNIHWTEIKDYVVSWGCHPVGRTPRS